MNTRNANDKCAQLTAQSVRRLACVVCAAPLPLGASGLRLGDGHGDSDDPTCTTVACRMVVGRRASMDEASFKQYLQTQARQTQQRLVQSRALQLRNQAEALENEAGWAALRALNVAPAAPAQPSLHLLELELLLPTGPQRRSKLPERRRQRYRDHLLRIIAEAQTLAPLTAPAPAAASELQAPSVADSSAPPEATIPSNLPGRLCGLCGGGCCPSGGDTAYLSVATIQRVMAQQPDLQANQLLDAYLAWLPDKPQTDACVNHGEKGCALPRALRSDICNDYVCESLARVESALEASQTMPGVQIKILVVQRQQNHWHGQQLGLAHAITGLAVMVAAGTDQFPSTAPMKIKPKF